MQGAIYSTLQKGEKMTKKFHYLRLMSELNPWIDFMIAYPAGANKKRLFRYAKKAFYDWFGNDSQDTIADYVSNKLTEKGIFHIVFFPFPHLEE